MDFHLHNETELRFERNDGHSNTFELRHYFRSYKDFPDYEKAVLSYVHGNVLNLGCGAGRPSVWLEKSGYSVTGFDSSPLALELCKRRGLSRLVRGDVHFLPFRRNSFDSVVLLGNGFGFAGKLEDTIRFLRQLGEMTTSHGPILTDSRNHLMTEEEAHLVCHERNRERGRPTGEVKIRALSGPEVSEWFRLHMVTPREMEQICAEAGWRAREHIQAEKSVYGAVLEKATS